MKDTKMFRILLISCVLVTARAVQKLDALQGDAGGVSVSGLSSGAAMAMQYHVAFSSSTRGAGIVAGVPYYCAKGTMMNAVNTCMKSPSGVDVSALERYIRSSAISGKIDDVTNVRGSNVYIFAGSSDSTVVPGEGRKAETLYKNLGANVKGVFNVAAAHGFPTENYGSQCGVQASPYINNCQYSAAYDLLNTIYGGALVKPSSATQLSSQLEEFDQTEFTKTGRFRRFLLTDWLKATTDTMKTWTNLWTSTATKTTATVTDLWTKALSGGGLTSWMDYLKNLQGSIIGSLPGFGSLPGLGGSLPGLGGLPGMGGLGGGISMDSLGYIYAPAACKTGQKKCRVHIALHGCQQGRSKVGDVFARRAGYNEVADANDIIVIYPQATENLTGGNPMGCWDWWGYSGQNYALKDGAQMKAIKAMVDRLTSYAN